MPVATNLMMKNLEYLSTFFFHSTRVDLTAHYCIYLTPAMGHISVGWLQLEVEYLCK